MIDFAEFARSIMEPILNKMWDDIWSRAPAIVDLRPVEAIIRHMANYDRLAP